MGAVTGVQALDARIHLSETLLWSRCPQRETTDTSWDPESLAWHRIPSGCYHPLPSSCPHHSPHQRLAIPHAALFFSLCWPWILSSKPVFMGCSLLGTPATPLFARPSSSCWDLFEHLFVHGPFSSLSCFYSFPVPKVFVCWFLLNSSLFGTLVGTSCMPTDFAAHFCILLSL